MYYFLHLQCKVCSNIVNLHVLFSNCLGHVLCFSCPRLWPGARGLYWGDYKWGTTALSVCAYVYMPLNFTCKLSNYVYTCYFILKASLRGIPSHFFFFFLQVVRTTVCFWKEPKEGQSEGFPIFCDYGINPPKHFTRPCFVYGFPSIEYRGLRKVSALNSYVCRVYVLLRYCNPFFG